MAELAILTPSRGRPQRFAEMVRAVRDTAAGSVEIWLGRDVDDESNYFDAVSDLPGADMVIATIGERRSLSAWTNHLAELALAAPDPPRYLASLGDDHRPRSKGWDRRLIYAIETQLGSPGFSYGNDLYQGIGLPTAWIASAQAVRALGWMTLPACEHLYVDTAVLELGRAAGRIMYCPDVVIEHLHPHAGKAAWDDSYRASNSLGRDTADRAAFEAWRRDSLDDDVRRLLGVGVSAAGRR